MRLCLGLAWVGKLRRQAVAAPAVWQARLDALAQRMGLQRRPPLKLHAGLSSPVTVGFWRPVILLPAALLSGMPVALLEALLAHELAHVRRWDYLVNLLQSVAEALLFFHPVVWWLSARMRAEREQVADALAAKRCRSRSSWPRRACAVLADGRAEPARLADVGPGRGVAHAHRTLDGARPGYRQLEDGRARLAAGLPTLLLQTQGKLPSAGDLAEPPRHAGLDRQRQTCGVR